jgi:hypothetical protein
VAARTTIASTHRYTEGIQDQRGSSGAKDAQEAHAPDDRVSTQDLQLVHADAHVLPQLSSVLRIRPGTTGPDATMLTSRSKSASVSVAADVVVSIAIPIPFRSISEFPGPGP